jgi:hypothetical protein
MFNEEVLIFPRPFLGEDRVRGRAYKNVRR